jgi:hypothetical protein
VTCKSSVGSRIMAVTGGFTSFSVNRIQTGRDCTSQSDEPQLTIYTTLINTLTIKTWRLYISLKKTYRHVPLYRPLGKHLFRKPMIVEIVEPSCTVYH